MRKYDLSLGLSPCSLIANIRSLLHTCMTAVGLYSHWLLGKLVTVMNGMKQGFQYLITLGPKMAMHLADIVHM